MASAVPRYQVSSAVRICAGTGMMKWLFKQTVRFPAVAQMLQERLALELDQNIDRVDSGIDQIAENEIDDPISTAERYGRLRSFFRQRIKAGSLPAGQHKREHPKLHVRLSVEARDVQPGNYCTHGLEKVQHS